MEKIRELWLRIKGTEFSVLAAFTVLTVSLLGFADLVDDVFEGKFRAFDEKILVWLRNADNLQTPRGPDWFHNAIIDFTSLGSTSILLLITLAAITYMLIDKKPGAALFVAAAVGSGTLLGNLLKLGFQRPRPDLVPHLVVVENYSFPSGHTMMATITYLTLGALLARVQKKRRVKVFIIGMAVLVALLTGFSRVYLGVHWPTDVLAGWCIGAAWAMACWLFARWLQHRGKIESDQKE